MHTCNKSYSIPFIAYHHHHWPPKCIYTEKKKKNQKQQQFHRNECGAERKKIYVHEYAYQLTQHVKQNNNEIKKGETHIQLRTYQISCNKYSHKNNNMWYALHFNQNEKKKKIMKSFINQIGVWFFFSFSEETTDTTNPHRMKNRHVHQLVRGLLPRHRKRNERAHHSQIR